MAAKAEADAKRKRSGPGKKGTKKQKTGENSAKLMVDAHKNAADMNKRPAFIQPPNLDKKCVLKDYQLEGVRWLVSLYENGVSGILGKFVNEAVHKLIFKLTGALN